MPGPPESIARLQTPETVPNRGTRGRLGTSAEMAMLVAVRRREANACRQYCQAPQECGFTLSGSLGLCL
jgi:hypothetical protein